jgi:uncharacterized protein YlxP (DUF503 family)
MVIGIARVVMHMPASQSLKDKRQILKSLIAQVQRQYQVAAAEVERHDQWQIGVIGLSCVSTSASHADEVLAHSVGFLASRNMDAALLEYKTEIIHAF